MKKCIFVVLLLVFVMPFIGRQMSVVAAPNSIDNLIKDSRIAVKAKTYTGYLLPFSTFDDHDYTVALGGEVSMELLPVTSRSWISQWHYPTIGLSALGIDLAAGDKNELGQLFALYPYLSWSLGKVNINRYSSLEFNARLGFGVAFLNKLSYASGSYVSGIFASGISGQVNLRSGYSWFLELGTNHINNAELRQPSTTMNLAYGSFGVRYHFNKDNYQEVVPTLSQKLPYNWMYNFSLTGGYRDVYFVDKSRAKIVTLNFNGLKKLSNVLAMGPGLDIFYNSAFVKQGLDGGTYYGDLISRSDYFLEDTKFLNKLRIGVSWNNIITMGNSMGIIADMGIYIYDPIRNAYPSDVTNGVTNPLPFFYKYTPKDEDGWVYFRAGLRVRVVENLHLQVTAKTHLYRFEHLGFGLTYSLPISESRLYHNKGAGRYNIWKMSHAKKYLVGEVL